MKVDNKSRDRTDYYIENLRWVSKSKNEKKIKKSSNLNVTYEFVTDLPDDAIVVNDYDNHQFEDNYFHYNVFFFYNGILYRKLHVNENKRSGSKYSNDATVFL